MVEVHVTLGVVMLIAAQDRYNPDDGPLRIYVCGVRAPTNPPLRDAWVWVEGTRALDRAEAGAPMSALVRVSVFAPAKTRTTR